ncbi:MAG: riboflavin synthase [Chloroflexi bacterium]|nr:riboflavin synthase [Chloroflexota bacterium]MCL5109086.1 riboflavin synthase [Chloroflexota bacterium]
MFTGIVEEVGRVIALRAGAEPRLHLAAETVLEGLRLGDSVAVNGACLTITSLDKAGFAVGLMPETLRLTNLGALRPGDEVNLERALAAGSRLGGHFVQGHVDGVGRVLAIRREQQAFLIRFAAPPEVLRYVVAKGFIAVDGISLTVTECDNDSFSVSLVTYTQQNVTLAQRKVGNSVNLEADILGKYVERFVRPQSGGLTANFLAEHGFTGLGRPE